MLKREDMRKEAMPFDNREDTIGQIPVVHHDIAASGIDYVTLMFECNDIPQEDIAYLGVLRAVLGYVNTKHYSYAGLFNAINIYTGGISCGVSVYPKVNERDLVSVKFEVRIRVLEKNLEEAMKLVDEIVRTSDITDVKRLTELIAQVKSRLQVSLSSSGHTVAAMRALSYQSRYAFYQDATLGIEYYQHITRLDEQIRTNPEGVVKKLQEMIDKVLVRKRLMVSFTADQKAFEAAKPVMETYLNRIAQGDAAGEQTKLELSRKNEGFTDASQIQYVARGGNFCDHGFTYRGSLKILKLIMSYEYLWINIRVKGGAYGCMSSFLRTGESYFVSYRDPNLGKTIDIYEHIPDYLRSFTADERDMTKYVIGTFGSLDTPMNPEAKGSRSMSAYLQELPFEQIQRERDEILHATPEDIRNLADLIAAVLEDDSLCVIGNENAIRAKSGLFDSVQTLC